MAVTTLHIKNMVCDRCKLVVNQELEKLGLHPVRVELGEVELRDAIDKENLERVDHALEALGFERIDDRKARLVENIKTKVIEKIRTDAQQDRKFNWSDILADELNHDYSSMSNLFSSVEGITLEQYIIRQKIERAKELLFYDELNLSQIALKLGYSSVAHLSAQFKKITGLTPSELKKSRTSGEARKPLDRVADK